MAEFCSNCPMKGLCVGEVTPEIKFGKNNDVRVAFVDTDGMHSSGIEERLPGHPRDVAEEELRENELALGRAIVGRIDMCNGTGNVIDQACPAFNLQRLSVLAEKVIKKSL